MMFRILPASLFFLASLPAHAQDAAAEFPKPGDADPTAMIVVILLLVGMCGGFLWYILWQEKKRKRKVVREEPNTATSQQR